MGLPLNARRLALLLLLTALAAGADDGAGADKGECSAALAKAAELLGAGDERLKAVEIASESADAHLLLATAMVRRAGVEVSGEDAPAAGSAESEDEAKGKAVASAAAADVSAAESATGAAVQLLWRALELDPAHDVAKNRLLDCASAWTAGRQRREDGAMAAAVSLYDRLLERQPEDPTPLYGLASAYHVVGDRAKAVEALERAIKLAPDDHETHHTLTNLHSQQQAWKPALAAAARAAELKPDEPEYARQHGMMLANNMKVDEAVAELRRASELAPDNEAIKATVQHLQKKIDEIEAQRQQAQAQAQAQEEAQGAGADEDEDILYGDLLDGADDEEGGVAM